VKDRKRHIAFGMLGTAVGGVGVGGGGERRGYGGIKVEVVGMRPGQKGFTPLPKRWTLQRAYEYAP
jgi:hypothetical protein